MIVKPLLIAVAFAAAAPASVFAATGPSDDEQIRSLRISYNRAIAERRPDLFHDFLAPDFVEVYGEAMVNKGADVIARDYADHVFNNPNFISYDRRTQSVDFSADATVAVERGRYTGHDKVGGGGEACSSGLYQAGWIKIAGKWRVQTETYTQLSKSGERPC